MVSFTSMGSTVRRDISFIYSYLAPEDTWAETAHAWVFMVKLGGAMGGTFLFKNQSLKKFPDDNLTASHASTKMEFM